MLLKNTDVRYGFISILLHWLLAFLVIGMLCVGLYMTSLPDSFQKLKLFGYHKETGICILGMAVIRLSWKYVNIAPSLATLHWLERIAACTVHWALYGFLLAMPITGWCMSSAAGITVSFFGWFLLPNLVSANPHWFQVFRDLHGYLAYALIVTIILHAGAALKHHFIDKDTILKRMLPW